MAKIPKRALCLVAACMICQQAVASPRVMLCRYGVEGKKSVSHIRTIVIDPGHGGKDDGATGPFNLREKDVTLRIALALQKILTREGFRVIMTRQNDRYLTLQERAQIVNASEADFFISLHANAAKNKMARGYETYYLSDPANDPYDPETPPEEGYNRYEHFLDGDKELGRIYLGLLDKASSEDRARSIELAETIHDVMKKRLPSRNRGVKRARFFVLKNTRIPAVLIEVGFLSNPKEAILLRSPRHQERVARAIANGVITFRTSQDSASLLVEK